jgi:hypothetical protein
MTVTIPRELADQIDELIGELAHYGAMTSEMAREADQARSALRQAMNQEAATA